MDCASRKSLRPSATRTLRGLPFRGAFDLKFDAGLNRSKGYHPADALNVRQFLPHRLCAPAGSRTEGRSMMTTLKRFLCCESGATAIEYGVIAGGIAVATMAIVYQVGDKMNTNVFTPIANTLAAAK